MELQAGPHTITAADPLPADLRAALDKIHGRSAAHWHKSGRTLRR